MTRHNHGLDEGATVSGTGAIRTRTFRGEYLVECQRAGCDFWRDSGNCDADRMAGRRHTVATGHSVRATSTRITYFEAP